MDEACEGIVEETIADLNGGKGDNCGIGSSEFSEKDRDTLISASAVPPSRGPFIMSL